GRGEGRISYKSADFSGQAGTAMPAISCGLRLTAVAAALLLSTAASAQLFQQPPQARPAPGAARPAATAPAPGPAAPRPVASAPSPRAAACHGGASFDKFLADLKQRAVSEGVSQRTLVAAAPYLVYA